MGCILKKEENNNYMTKGANHNNNKEIVIKIGLRKENLK